MGYRRTGSNEKRQFDLFMRDNIELVNKCVLPSPLVASERNWWYLLEHGYFDYYNIDKITEQQTVALTALVRAYLKAKNDPSFYLDRKLELLIEKWHGKDNPN